MARDLASWLPSLLGPITISWDGVDQTARPTLNFKGGVLTDDDVNDRLDLDFGSHSSGALKIYNPLGTFYYTIEGSAIVANRTVTLPLLTAGDTLVCQAFAQTLTNKTLTSPVLTTPQINDTSADHQYVFAVSELAADRTVTLPLLTGADEFVFKDHAVTLSNKTIASPVISGTPRYNLTTYGNIRSVVTETQLATVTPTSIGSFTMSDETLVTFDFIATAAKTTAVTKGGRYKGSVTYRRTSAGAPTIVGAAEYATAQETEANTVEFNVSSNDVQVRVTQADTDERNWILELRVQETNAVT